MVLFNDTLKGHRISARAHAGFRFTKHSSSRTKSHKGNSHVQETSNFTYSMTESELASPSHFSANVAQVHSTFESIKALSIKHPDKVDGIIRAIYNLNAGDRTRKAHSM